MLRVLDFRRRRGRCCWLPAHRTPTYAALCAATSATTPPATPRRRSNPTRYFVTYRARGRRPMSRAHGRLRACCARPDLTLQNGREWFWVDRRSLRSARGWPARGGLASASALAAAAMAGAAASSGGVGMTCPAGPTKPERRTGARGDDLRDPLRRRRQARRSERLRRALCDQQEPYGLGYRPADDESCCWVALGGAAGRQRRATASGWRRRASVRRGVPVGHACGERASAASPWGCWRRALALTRKALRLAARRGPPGRLHHVFGVFAGDGAADGAPTRPRGALCRLLRWC
jgi:hypothetical protein